MNAWSVGLGGFNSTLGFLGCRAIASLRASRSSLWAAACHCSAGLASACQGGSGFTCGSLGWLAMPWRAEEHRMGALASTSEIEALIAPHLDGELGQM